MPEINPAPRVRERRPSRMLVAWLVCAFGCALASNAWAQGGRVVIVETKGAMEWRVVERRLEAELLEAGQNVVCLRATAEIDRRLATYARQFDADAVLQIVRFEREGVVRVWLSDEWRISGTYRHVQVDLRGADVVSEATLPAIELALNGWRELSRPFPESRPKPPQVRYFPDRAAALVTLRAMFGVLFPGGGIAPSANLVVGARVGIVRMLTADAELFGLPGRAAIGQDAVSLTLGLAGVRGFLMFEPWPQSAISAAIGVGGGVLRVETAPRGTAPDAADVRYIPVVAARAQLSAPIFQRFDVVVGFTWTKAPSAVRLVPGPRRLVTPFELGFDAMVGLNLHWF